MTRGGRLLASSIYTRCIERFEIKNFKVFFVFRPAAKTSFEKSIEVNLKKMYKMLFQPFRKNENETNDTAMVSPDWFIIRYMRVLLGWVFLVVVAEWCE